MNLQSILSDNTPPPPKLAQIPENNGIPTNGHGSNGTNGKVGEGAENGHNPDLIDRQYLSEFELRVSVLNKLDRTLAMALNVQTLAFEKDHLRSVLKNLDPIAANFVDRIVAEDVLADNIETSKTREYNWGSTRNRNAEDPAAREERKVQLQESAVALLNSDLKFEEEATPEDEKANKRTTSSESHETKRRRVEDTPAEILEKGRLRDSKENGRVRMRVPVKDESSDPALADAKLSPTKAKELKSVQKQYDNTFVAIWKDMLRKDGPKVSRLMQQTNQARLINLRKTAALASREAKRWQLKNNKNQKDLTSKARRAMREMHNFWKKNERLERDQKKKHEKEKIDKAKKEEEDREAKRQLRKLNFLITQTELYSHFISKKIKTDEIEGADLDPNLSLNLGAGQKGENHLDKYHGVEGSATDIHSLDFDNDDEDALHRAAAGNAQRALDSARSRAEAYDDPFRNPDTNGEEMNFQNPTLLGDMTVLQPDMLRCTLKEYQLKGLNWLANLYEQGINGILADEMGLGKTVQSISVLAYLAETHNIWGPYLVVTPASTLHNWQQEISKFVPEFKVLPYWGNGKDRKVLRKFWDRKSLRYGKDAPFHVLVTSYQLVVSDAPYFQKMKWQYMILDEAQAIKSSQSSRWKSLLSFSCRNRLLLTGTPIQNSMQELWALLHFIMPSLFDSHDEFSDWFSKDIESHAQSNTQLNENQLKRLHVILKPFMLRRVKKNVQSELGDKVEIDIFCDLTNRQKKYYQMLKSQISLVDLLSTSNNDDSNQSLMNLVMQFRKVCNHPDLFERADVKSSFVFGSFAETGSFLRETDLEVSYSLQNHIHYRIPKQVYHELLVPGNNSDVGPKSKLLEKFSIYDPQNVSNDTLDNFGWLKFVDTSPGELKKLTHQNLVERAIDLHLYTGDNYSKVSKFDEVYDGEFTPNNKRLLIDVKTSYSKTRGSNILRDLTSVQSIVYDDIYANVAEPAANPIVATAPIEADCSDYTFTRNLENARMDQKYKSVLVPLTLNTELDLLQKKIPLAEYPKSDMAPAPLNGLIGHSNIRMPSMTRFITESGKLSKLDKLLDVLKRDGHRVLVYFQMTKMMDLMEEFLTYRQHNYIRLDGSSKLEDRRDLVHDWQTKPEIFVFLLSTRAGGLGINLTAADTVIFYDSDWNPTIDSQAMDRAHRLGQTKQVTVYRLLTKGTIELRMRDRAKQKEQVQQVVMEGKLLFNKKKEDAVNKKKDVAFLLLGGDIDNDIDNDNNNVSSDSGTNTPGMAKTLEAMYHEGEGDFSGNITPAP